ncbi:MAG: STAS domain-containing protein [Spirochaetes bacterium]|nr:STAS domain-containing protein [Spirochaetota bacterium]
MTIEVNENIGVKTVKKFYLELKELLKKEAEIILDLQNVKRLDLSVVQVLIAANRECMKNNKSIKLKSVSKDIKRQLYLAGFSN